MIVFDLFCAAGHRFEAWFRDNSAFDEQQRDKAIRCPTCGDTQVVKAPTPMRVMQSRGQPVSAAGQEASPAEDAPPVATPPVPPAITDALQQLREQVESSCDYVGERFAEEARSMHYGEKDGRSIYGEASAEEAKTLREEGIAIQPLPWLTRRNG